MDVVAEDRLAPRLRRLPRLIVCGRTVAVASDRRARLLGLTLLERERAGAGLLLPGCRSVHTVGMRFAIDVLFLDRECEVLRIERSVGSCRLLGERRAAAVLELPSARAEAHDSSDQKPDSFVM